MNDKIKVLFLDIDNTLLDFDAAAAWAMEQCFQKAGLEYKSEMFAAFTEENNKIWQRIERKELSMDEPVLCALAGNSWASWTGGRRC